VFADRYSTSLLTVVALHSGAVLHQSPASLHWHGNLDPLAGAAWLLALLGGDATALDAVLADVREQRVARLQARAAPGRDSAAAAAAVCMLHCWHEVALTPGVDPVTAEAVVVVTETDVSALKAAEAEVARLHAAQIADAARAQAALQTLLCSCFPEHVVQDLLDGLLEPQPAAAAALAEDDSAALIAAAVSAPASPHAPPARCGLLDMAALPPLPDGRCARRSAPALSCVTDLSDDDSAAPTASRGTSTSTAVLERCARLPRAPRTCLLGLAALTAALHRLRCAGCTPTARWAASLRGATTASPSSFPTACTRRVSAPAPSH
jgi:hypothetical protein